MDTKIDITGVPETMIQTLYARAQESRRADHRIYDPKAIEIVDAIDYDFDNASKDSIMSSGVIARTILLDNMVGSWLEEHPTSTVVNIACGLDMRCYRMGGEDTRWYNLDLPETIDIRQRFVTEDGRISMIAASAMDPAWVREVQTDGNPVLVIVEGLSMYLSQDDVRQMLAVIHEGLPGATVYLEFLNPRFVGKDVERSIKGSGASFTFGAKGGEELAALVDGVAWEGDRSLAETMPQVSPSWRLVGWIPAVRHLSNKIAVLRA